MFKLKNDNILVGESNIGRSYYAEKIAYEKNFELIDLEKLNNEEAIQLIKFFKQRRIYCSN